MPPRIDLTGQRFGRLVVKNFAGTSTGREAIWSCKCDCGKTVIVRGVNLRNGHTKSCGCSHTLHGKSYTRLHRIWADMKTRRYNTQNRAYKNYGGRGITICDEWLDDFQKFYSWAINFGYRNDLTIDRIDNDKGYCPDNCRWVTIKVQNNNKRNNVRIDYKGKSQTLAQWSTLVWETVEDIYVNAGETYADVIIQCQTTGTAGNGYVAGQINTIVDLFAYFQSCANLNESDGGGDKASDEEFYELLRLSMDAYSTAGARGSYVYWAMQVDTKIADVIAASPTPGVVKLYILMNDGTIATEEIKGKVLAACSADDRRPLTDFVSVDDPEKVEYNVDLTYYIQSDAEASAEELALAVEEKVKKFTDWQSAKLGRDINPSRLISLLMETGIKRVELKEPAFTSLRDGSGTEAPQVAVLGTVTIKSGGYRRLL